MWAVFAPIYPTACFYNSQKSFKFALENTQSLSFWLQHVLRNQGPVKEAGTELHEAMPLPHRASFSHTLMQNISEPSKQKTGKKPIPSPHLHPRGRAAGLLGILPASATMVLARVVSIFHKLPKQRKSGVATLSTFLSTDFLFPPFTMLWFELRTSHTEFYAEREARPFCSRRYVHQTHLPLS